MTASPVKSTASVLKRASTSLSRRRNFSSSLRTRRELAPPQDAYILSAARTPVALFNSSFATVPAPTLGGHAIREAVSRSSLDPSAITAVYMGNVLSAGMGQAPARQASISGGLSTSVDATTVNKVCSSGLKAVTLAAQAIQLGLNDAVVAGGMENMSRTPYYSPRAGQMPPFGEVPLRDGMISDGLWDVYNNIHMGNCAENTVKTHKLTREAQDEFAIESYKRAKAAWDAGDFDAEVVPVTVKTRKGDKVISSDEGVAKLNLEKIPGLKPAFVRDGSGTVTAANASSFNDGASALVLASASLASQHASKSRVLARIVSSADAALDPIDFPVAPAKAVPIALQRAGLEAKDIAVWEFNEAFAAVVLANAKILNMQNDMHKINPRGGAIALGHAIGSSGSRILITLLHQLKVGEFGCAAICNGGGAATAVIVQRVDAV